ncbi:MAG: hypothetical protein ACLP0A_01800, partial [Verrucomicrobiia bacterium]
VETTYCGNLEPQQRLSNRKNHPVTGVPITRVDDPMDVAVLEEAEGNDGDFVVRAHGRARSEGPLQSGGLGSIPPCARGEIVTRIPHWPLTRRLTCHSPHWKITG